MKETTSFRLKRLMEERNLRQVDILEKAAPYCKKYGVKLNKSDLSQYITGKVVPGQDKLSVLGLALGVSEAWLMGYDVPIERKTALTTSQSDERVEEYLKLFVQLNPDQQDAIIHMIKCFLNK